jgi:hypothetical protein
MNWTDLFLRRAKQHEDNERMAARQYNLSIAQHELNLQRTQQLNQFEREELERLRAKNKSLLDARKRTDLPRLRCYDLAGYLGRVQELLSFASFLIAKEHSEASTRLRNACSMAYTIQNELLVIANELTELEERETEARQVAELEGEPPAKLDPTAGVMPDTQWTSEELAKMQRFGGGAFIPNRIKQFCAACDGTGHTRGNNSRVCPACEGHGKL